MSTRLVKGNEDDGCEGLDQKDRGPWERESARTDQKVKVHLKMKPNNLDFSFHYEAKIQFFIRGMRTLMGSSTRVNYLQFTSLDDATMPFLSFFCLKSWRHHYIEGPT